MKTTRAKIIDFLNMFLDDPIRDSSVWANALIESGLVEIEEEQKEFLLCDSCSNSFRLIPNTLSNILCCGKIIHVHSVDHCKKYEKMWKELKEWTYQKAFHCYKDKEMVTSVIEDLEKENKI